MQLRFNHSGAAKLWLNGKLILSDEKQRAAQNIDPDVFVITQKLETGWNSLLVKIAADAPNEAIFSLRLTDDKGADLQTLQSEAARYKWQVLSGESEPRCARFVKEFS